MIRSACKKIGKSAFVESLLFHQQENSSSVWFVEIDPKRIKHITLIPESSDSLTGEDAYTGVCSGLWNYAKRPFKNHSFYRAVSDILNNEPYHHTAIYKKVNQGRISEKEALRITKKLKWLMNILPNTGYLSQYQLGKMDQTSFLGDIEFPEHEIIVGLDSNGDFVRLAGGKHRLAVAQQVGIERIPAILSIVHENAIDMLPAKRRLVKGDPEDFRPISASGIYAVNMPATL
ncbi:hypothetical protein DYD21_20365 [Rhodohalobacter sp. SW132]|uniref:hypothetical protein n=1 Tax=Rhodohalobacter sp. SW132 TaxID=2293433 RepID=UPI000E237471|nr:hypothetical protein [Rhodohalobacter sp. SW132]REL23995.1 hypothetical protein DYD21_20365 [Rhodohalobacter sp. SW132]